MDRLNLLLCDELVLEILLRLPSNSKSNSIPLVCKRWLILHRSSKTNLSLRIPISSSASSSSSLLSTILSHYPSLLSLTLLLQNVVVSSSSSSSHPTTLQPHSLLHPIASHCHNLRHLRFLLGPISPSALTALSASCRSLTSLNIHSSLQSLFSNPTWLFSFPHLKGLSVYDTSSNSSCGALFAPNLVEHDGGDDDEDGGTQRGELPLESLGWNWPGELGHGMAVAQLHQPLQA